MKAIRPSAARGSSAFIALAVARARQLQRDREAEIGNERKRMRRVDRERRQHRKDVLQEIISEPGALLSSSAWPSTSRQYAS